MNPLLAHLRTLLILGRISNLPTVWSNLLVGWALATGPREGMMIEGQGPNDSPWSLLFVLIGGTFLYIGGMYLNDYCDAAFDARYCPQRPVPAGKISRKLVGLLGVLWLSIGFTFFTSFGPFTIEVALLLIAAIVLYDFHHKNVAWAPLIMGLCRGLLYVLAVSAVFDCYNFGNVYGAWWDKAAYFIRYDCWENAFYTTRWALPAAIPVALYVAGITYVARNESRPGKSGRWPYLLLLPAIIGPIVVEILWLQSMHWLLAPGPNADLRLSEYLHIFPFVLVACLLLLGWMAWLLIPLWRKTNSSIGRVVSGLLAGLILVDLNMVMTLPAVPPQAALLTWLPLFLLALVLQRFIPAT